MKLVKALKLKNRLAGNIARTQALIERENSQPEKTYNHEKITLLVDNLFNDRNELIELKAKIQVKTAPIAHKLIKLAELKGEITWFQELNCREGEFNQGYGAEKDIIVYKAYYNQDTIDQMVGTIQEQIDELQDEIDDYNATKSIQH
jgi:hypothetical protein